MENTRPSRAVGLFVLLTLAVIAGLILNFSKGSSVFSRGYVISVRAGNVGGLTRGAGVMMAGVAVGSVKAIRLAPDGRSVLVDCFILRPYAIHADANFEIEQSGFLGDQFVSITPTKNEGKTLSGGDEVQAHSPFNLQEAARSAIALMQRLDGAAAKIDAAVDRVERQLLSAETLGNITSTVSSIRRTSETVESAVTELQTLIRTNAVAITGSLSNLHAFSGRLTGFGDQVSNVLDHANGVVGNVDSVINDNKQSIHTSLSSLQASGENIRQLTADLQAGKGLAGALLKNDRLNTQLEEIVVNLNTLSSNLARFGLLHKPKASLPKPIGTGTPYSGRTGFP